MANELFRVELIDLCNLNVPFSFSVFDNSSSIKSFNYNYNNNIILSHENDDISESAQWQKLETDLQISINATIKLFLLQNIY